MFSNIFWNQSIDYKSYSISLYDDFLFAVQIN